MQMRLEDIPMVLFSNCGYLGGLRVKDATAFVNGTGIIVDAGWAAC
jgi:hypothetical protein